MRKWLLLLLLCTSCCLIDEYPPSLYIYNVRPTVEYYRFQDDGLIYKFEESLEYKELDTLYADVYRNGNYYLTKQCDTSCVPVSVEDDIDVIVSNIKLEGGKFLKVKSEYIEPLDFLDKLPYCYTINDAFIGKKSFPITIHGYEWNHYTNYCCTQIYMQIKPVTHHYVIQIVSDDKEIVCDSLFISGLSYRYDIINERITNDLCNSYLPLYDKQIIGSYSVYASRFNTFELPSDDSSWHIIDDGKIYIVFKLVNCSKYIKVDISRKIYSLPKGGVITVFIDTSEITPTSDFIIEIDDWDTHIIDIDF